MDKGDINIAKEVLVYMTERYSKKEETAEAYYYLGYMGIMEDFNLGNEKR